MAISNFIANGKASATIRGNYAVQKSVGQGCMSNHCYRNVKPYIVDACALVRWAKGSYASVASSH